METVKNYTDVDILKAGKKKKMTAGMKAIHQSSVKMLNWHTAAEIPLKAILYSSTKLL